MRRDAVELPGAMRWVERRVRLVHHVLTIVIGLLPEQLARCIAEMGAVRTRLKTETALRALRTLATARFGHAADELNASSSATIHTASGQRTFSTVSASRTESGRR